MKRLLRLIYAPLKHSRSPLKALILFGMALVATIAIASCTANNQPKLLKVGLNTWPGFDIALYGQTSEIFANRGLDVEFVRFDVAQDTVRALLRGSLDLAFVSLWDAMQADPGEENPAYIMVTNVSYGSDGVVAQPNIDTVADLKGKTVAAKLGSVNHLIFLEALAAHQVDPLEVNIADITNEEAEAEMLAGSLDAAVLWEPMLGQTATAIDGKVLFTTADVDSHVVDGLIARSSYLETNAAEVEAFILSWFDIMQAVDETPEEVFQAVGEQLGQAPEDFAADYGGLKKGDIAMHERMFLGQDRLAAVQAEIVRFLEQDPRHGRVIREDLEINPKPVENAIQAWKQ
ncbi:ABC transporter substrate-binding protein [Leptolyngbya sp. PCC 6406]|uniref:ABC transporter substrate-binding protein n=1 Tax=Leptolyngbya sp. PCC 6406 TaxID=1173264 RepID=UPI0002ACCB64|nr:ABC transporter substrate-binding protein [Leptolyngbya sp. PCC 6406]